MTLIVYKCICIVTMTHSISASATLSFHTVSLRKKQSCAYEYAPLVGPK